MMGFFIYSRVFTEHLRGSGGKESACSVGDLGSISGLGRSPGGENGYPRQYSCLENPTDRGAWWATVPGPSSGPHFVRILHHDPFILGGPTWHGS